MTPVLGDLGELERLPNLLVAPFAEGGIGSVMCEAAHAYADDYVLCREGPDHEPTEFERELLNDFFNGLISDEGFFGPVLALLAHVKGLEGERDEANRRRGVAENLRGAEIDIADHWRAEWAAEVGKREAAEQRMEEAYVFIGKRNTAVENWEAALTSANVELAASQAREKVFREGLENIAVEEFTGPVGISIYAAAANELSRVKAVARALLNPEGSDVLSTGGKGDLKTAGADSAALAFGSAASVTPSQSEGGEP